MTQTTNVPLTTLQIRFLMDVLMGSQLGVTKIFAHQNGVDDSATYNHLQNCLPTGPEPSDAW